ncbi:MAG: exodeoxyribonuclease VII small subunit [Bacteroidia bacterium]|nr:exodeoxyribonuclease VII small subunit [Bacteroidia bacterium]
MKDKTTYAEAFNELQNIVTEIEKGEINVDELSARVKRAAELIKLCKIKLTTTEEDVKTILQEIERADTANEE